LTRASITLEEEFLGGLPGQAWPSPAMRGASAVPFMPELDSGFITRKRAGFHGPAPGPVGDP
jgi:hypothetical protein